MIKRESVIKLLQLCCFFIFFGRAWQHIVWDAPFRAFFWDEDLLSGIIPIITGMSWQEYATSVAGDNFINGLKVAIGIFYLMMSVFSLVAHKEFAKKIRWTLLVGGVFLLSLGILYYKEKFLQVGQLFEYSTQIGTPFLLYFMLQEKISDARFILFAKLLIAFTFICHGLYALGYYPQPGHFVGMVIRITGFNEGISRFLLSSFGWLDLVLSVLIFIPITARWALLYCAFWGLATAIARVWANFYIDFIWSILNQWTFQMLIRLPHGLLPLLLIYPLKDHFPFLNKSGEEPVVE